MGVFYGGGVPIKNGTVGSLVIEKSAVEDEEFLARLKQTSDHKVLDKGTKVLVALTIKNHNDGTPSPALIKHLRSMGSLSKHLGTEYFTTVRSPDTQFVEVTIGPPINEKQQEFPKDGGGVWLRLQGAQAKSIHVSSVIVPNEISTQNLDSLNHAFTLLSEVYEPWRKSHTGNVYERILYQEKNKKWYPLEVIRRAAIAEAEHELIRAQWEKISKTLGFASNAGKR